MSKTTDFAFKRSRDRDRESTFRNFGNSCQLANKNKNDYYLYENYVGNYYIATYRIKYRHNCVVTF